MLRYEAELEGAEKLAFGGFCDALGDLVTNVIDRVPEQRRHKMLRQISSGEAWIGIAVSMDPVSTRITLCNASRKGETILYEVVGTPDGERSGRRPKRGPRPRTGPYARHSDQPGP